MEVRMAETIGSLLGLQPGERVRLTLFNVQEALELLLDSRAGEDEAGAAKLNALEALRAAAHPLQCVVCRRPDVVIGLLGYARGALSGVAFCLCHDCTRGADDLPAEVVEAVGGGELSVAKDTGE
jgi:hypothetical protein